MPLTPAQELWGCALAMIRHHGVDAEVRAAELADQMLGKGDLAGRRAWLTILANIKVTRQAEASRH